MEAQCRKKNLRHRANKIINVSFFFFVSRKRENSLSRRCGTQTHFLLWIKCNAKENQFLNTTFKRTPLSQQSGPSRENSPLGSACSSCSSSSSSVSCLAPARARCCAVFSFLVLESHCSCQGRRCVSDPFSVVLV